jgi:hypothetical protein
MVVKFFFLLIVQTIVRLLLSFILVIRFAHWYLCSCSFLV